MVPKKYKEEKDTSAIKIKKTYFNRKKIKEIITIFLVIKKSKKIEKIVANNTTNTNIKPTITAYKYCFMKSRNKTIIAVLCILNALTIMNGLSQSNTQKIDNSKKSFLARGCDPHASLEASKMIPLIGHPKYVPTT